MEASVLRSMSAGRWRAILLDLAPELGDAIKRAGRHVDCPMPGHGATGKGDFRMFADYNDTGGAICTCGCFSDGFSLLMQLRGWSFPETIKAVATWLQGGIPDRPARHGAKVFAAESTETPEERHERDKRKFEKMQEMWGAAYLLTDKRSKVAWWYFASRHISARWAAQYTALRLHPGLPFYQDKKAVGTFPTLLAMFRGSDGRPVTLHRTYLTDTGAKVPFENARKIMPLPSSFKLAGGAIRLGKPGRVLGIAEGIETALSVSCATRQSVWSCYSANGVAAFTPPEGVREVWAWADNDPVNPRTGLHAGIEAAKKLKRRLHGSGIACRIMLPPIPPLHEGDGVDWNDVLAVEGLAGFPAAKHFVPLIPPFKTDGPTEKQARAC